MGQGILTLTELKAEIVANLGNRTDLNDRLTRFLNLAQQRLATIKDFQEMQQTTSSAFTITSNASTDKIISFTSLREIHSFRVIDGSQSGKLKQVSTRQWDKVIPEPEYYARGVPTHYTIWQRSAELWKVPDQAYDYVVRWTKWPTAFSDSSLSATSDYLAKDLLLISLATAYAFDSLNKTTEADRKYRQVGQLFMEAIHTDAVEPDLEFAPSKEIFGANVGTAEYWRNPFLLDSP